MGTVLDFVEDPANTIICYEKQTPIKQNLGTKEQNFKTYTVWRNSAYETSLMHFIIYEEPWDVPQH